MKIQLKNNVVANKLLAFRLLKLNIYKKLYNFTINLNATKLNLKHTIQIVYKYTINHKQILAINMLKNTFFNELSSIKFLLFY